LPPRAATQELPMSTPPPEEASSDKNAFSFSPQQALEFMQRMWNPFGMPIPGFGLPGAPGTPTVQAPALPFPNPAAMFASLDPTEIERKIAELRVIEGWLQMSLNLMQMSIKTMELQKASLEALRGASQTSPPEQSTPRTPPPRRKS
jgi:hypothetical protein